MHIRPRLTGPAIGAVFAPAVSLTALSYSNGYSWIVATALGTATAAFGLWAVVTE